jgi:hypothetical protein
MSGLVTVFINGAHKTLVPGDTLNINGVEVLTVTSVDGTDLEPSYEPKTVSISFKEIPEVDEWNLEDDPIKHPRHYTDVVPGVECKDVIGYFPHHVGAAIKYLWRHRSKGKPVQDLRKAIEFIQFEIERLEKSDSEDAETTTTDGPSREDAVEGCRIQSD